MANTKESLMSLCDIIRDDVQFIVPDYQRGYSWGEEQLDALWEDLENITGDRYHYTGMFTFCKVRPEDKSYQIVDGQQRMTTLIILINELLSKINGGIANGSSVEEYTKKYLYKKPYGSLSNEYRFQYSVDNPSDAFFKTQILEQEESCSYSQPQDTLYTRNLRAAKSYFANKISELSQPQLAELFIKVTEKLKFNEYLIEDIDEVYVTFETMNNRGKNLSTLELLKNRLIYLSTLYANLSEHDPVELANVDRLRTDINNAWKTVYEYLGKSVKKTLNDDTFLRDHWIMYFRYDRSASMVFRKDLLSDHFTAKNVLNGILSIQEIDTFVLNLQKSIINWFNINCPDESSLPDSSKAWLARLNRVSIGSFTPLLMAAYLHNKVEEVLPLVQACERFRFLVSSISARRSNTSDSHFYSLAHDYFINPSVFNLVADVEGQTNYWTSIPNFINACVDRYQHQEGFYSWGGRRYFLYEYEKHLQKRGEVKVEWDTFEKNQGGKVSVEHIYPQIADDPYWISRFTTDADKALTHSLGNLLLLSKSKNSELQNDSFDKKKKTVKDDDGNIIHNGYDNGSYSELEVARVDEWTPDEIIKRGKIMLRFLHDHWSINYTFTEEDINKLLNISGVVPQQSNQLSIEEDEANSSDDFESIDNGIIEEE